DAVGACVGIKGSRVQAIVRELGGEKIDIVPWSQDPVVFVTRSLSPAKVLEAQIVENEQKVLVSVADDQLSLAIGKGGQNARLAAKLTGWKIDLISKSERDRQKELEKRSRIDIEELEGAGPKLREKLIREGIETVQDLLKASMEEILAIQGIGEKTAEKLIEEAKALQERRGRELAEETARAAAEAARAAEESARAASEPQLTDAAEPALESPDEPSKKTGALFEESARLRHGAELDEDEEVAERVETEEGYAPEEAAVKERDPDEVGAAAPAEDKDTNETRDDAS
ncbi:MAG TPA: helix-hairpin-helix domain-containing protein, partial [Candidatus Saccharimonadales bacterium]|nr:helix-hairpin-helix domain-containing protein [Candidatus Saccharimonadales bacterium]